MKILKMRLENFQGVKELEIDPQGESSAIYGDNGTGKSTVYNAFTWLMYGKPSTTEKNYTPKTTGSHNLHHSVEMTVELADGSEMVLKKDYHEVYKTIKGNPQPVLSGHTTDYSMDGVPVSETQFKKNLLEIYHDEELAKMLTSYNYFLENMKVADRRKILLQVCGDADFNEVIESQGDLLRELPEMLRKPGKTENYYTVDEYRAIAAKEKSLTDKELGDIPQRIDEAEKAKPDVTGLDAQIIDNTMAEIKEKRRELESQRAARESGATTTIRQQIAELESQRASGEAKHVRAESEANKGTYERISNLRYMASMMSQVGAISGATGQAFEDLTAKAQEMGATTKFTATEAAEAFNYMAMAGWQPEQMISGISGIMNLAAASGESLGSTSDIVTDALTAFGLKASDSGHFADVLAKASASANTNVGMLGESFKYVAPVAGAMKYSVEDTSLALGLMANSSIKGSMAGTALKTSLANMAAPTDSMATAMEKYGISLTDSSGNMKTLKGVMDNLRGSLGGLSETEQTAAASTIFGKEAMAGMLAIINASEEDYNKLSDAIYNADGAAQDMSDTMLDNLEGSMTLMQSAVEGVQNSFGKRLTPYIRGVVDAITDATPAATAALTSLMDFVDGKAEGVKRTVKSKVGIFPVFDFHHHDFFPVLPVVFVWAG